MNGNFFEKCSYGAEGVQKTHGIGEGAGKNDEMRQRAGKTDLRGSRSVRVSGKREISCPRGLLGLAGFFSAALEAHDLLDQLTGLDVGLLDEGCRVVAGEDLAGGGVDEARKPPGGGLEHLAALAGRGGDAEFGRRAFGFASARGLWPAVAGRPGAAVKVATTTTAAAAGATHWTVAPGLTTGAIRPAAEPSGSRRISSILEAHNGSSKMRCGGSPPRLVILRTSHSVLQHTAERFL